MAGLDGKITIESGLRPCMVSVPDVQRFLKEMDVELFFKYDCVFKMPSREVKALFHGIHPVTGNALVEYEDGTIHEVEPTKIRLVDNAMREYAFPEMEEK